MRIATGIGRVARRARRLVSGRGSPEHSYKQVWNEAAMRDARGEILTGATPESFEQSGQQDAERLKQHLRGDDRVLNIGCGIGRVELYLAPQVKELWAIDVSGEMIRRARQRLAGLPNVNLREVGNTEFLEAFPDSHFDLVFSFLVLQHLDKEDAARYLQDTLRVLKPGGVFVGQFPNFLSPEYTGAFFQGVRASYRSPARVRVYTQPEVAHLFAALGFEAVRVTTATGDASATELHVVARRPDRSGA